MIPEITNFRKENLKYIVVGNSEFFISILDKFLLIVDSSDFYHGVANAGESFPQEEN